MENKVVTNLIKDLTRDMSTESAIFDQHMDRSDRNTIYNFVSTEETEENILIWDKRRLSQIGNQE